MKRIVLTLVVLMTASMQATTNPFELMGGAPGIPAGFPVPKPGADPMATLQGLAGMGQGIGGMSKPDLALALGISVVKLEQLCKQGQVIKVGEGAHGPVYSNVSALQACTQTADVRQTTDTKGK